jgi:hypothetical protein
MTQEQFKKAINDRHSHIKTLEKEIAELRDTYLNEHAKFEIGEKVIVIQKNWNDRVDQGIAFINRMWAQDSGKIEYRFNKPKKDGTMSSFRFYVSYHYEVKKLQSEQEDERSVATGLNQGTKADKQK